jgi:hypothetical protein
VVVLPVTGDTAEARLESVGLYVGWSDQKLMVEDVGINGSLETLGVSIEDPTEVLGVEIPQPRPSKWLFSLPGLVILALVAAVQLKRKRRESPQISSLDG